MEEKAENELKQEVGRTSLQTTAILQALAKKGARYYLKGRVRWDCMM